MSCSGGSRSVPINLYHDYRRTPFSAQDACQSCFPIFDAGAVRCTDPRYPILQAIFAQDLGLGVAREAILTAAASICPNFTRTALENAFAGALRSGILRTLRPTQIDFLAPTLPVNRYTFSPEMDRAASHAPFVKFLLSLVGGYNSAQFARYFRLTSSCCTSSNNPSVCQVCF